MDASVNGPLREGNQTVLTVWYSGTDALLQGQGLCYHYDYNSPERKTSNSTIAAETAASADFGRTNRVVKPGYGPSGGTSTVMYEKFAGVCAGNHNASPTGQMIRIYAPKSTCWVLTKATLVQGVGRITCQAGGAYAGYFTRSGFPGKGSAVPLQTKDTASTVGKTLCYLEDGPESGLVDVPVTGAAGGAQHLLSKGISFFPTATNAANVTATLANGVPGDKKGYVLEGTQTTSGLVITVTAGKKKDGTTTLANLASSTAAQYAILEWRYDSWVSLVSSTMTEN